MRILYSRTQFWFNLKAGGSVGHTSGVVDGFSRFAQVEIIGNERLYGLEGIPCTVVRPFFKKELLYNFRFAPALSAKVKDFKPDFIYHRFSGSSTATAKVCRKTGTPLVLEYNGSDAWVLRYWPGNRGRMRSRLYRALAEPVLEHNERFNLKSASLIVVVSEPLKAELVGKGFPEERILINPNAADTEKFKPASPDAQSALKKKLGIPEGRTIVGFSGTFGRWHGVPELAEAIVRLNENPSLRDRLFFVLYGDGELKGMIEKRTAHFENVLFAGTIEYAYIQDYLSFCDILVSPHCATPDGREFFGSPTKIFEYMAMGRGIVASRLGQIGEVLEDNHTAVLVEPGNVDDLVRGIVHLADHPEEAVRLGKNAREAAAEKHTWELHAKKIIDAFKDINPITS